MDEIPILIDTEPETSMEQDGVEQILTKATYSARRSLFDITFENSDEQTHESVEFKSYERRIHQEMAEWKSVFFNAYQDSKKSRQKHPVVDKSILPPEKREYLEKAVNLQSFIRESIEFRQQAKLFLEYDYPNLIEMVEILETFCEQKLNSIKAVKIAENLANIKKQQLNSKAI